MGGGNIIVLTIIPSPNKSQQASKAYYICENNENFALHPLSY